MDALVPIEIVERKILFIRGQKVILSSDLAELYGVEPKVLIQAVKRNIERFPGDFMFQLTNKEVTNLKSQFVTSSRTKTWRESSMPLKRNTMPSSRWSLMQFVN